MLTTRTAPSIGPSNPAFPFENIRAAPVRLRQPPPARDGSAGRRPLQPFRYAFSSVLSYESAPACGNALLRRRLILETDGEDFRAILPAVHFRYCRTFVTLPLILC